jgi:hypothetical protein
VGKHSPEFLAIFTSKESREVGFLNGDIKRFQDALLNLMTAITVLFSMKFCYQDVLFRSVISLVKYLKWRDFGQHSEVMLPFMQACAASMMTEWDEFREEINTFRRADPKITKATLLARGLDIPDLSRNGNIDKMYHFYFLKDSNGTGLASALISNYAAGSGGQSAAGASSTKDKKDGLKSSKNTRNEKSQAGKAGASSTSPPSTSASAHTATAKAGAGYCRRYNTSTGCDRSARECRFTHGNPPKDSLAAKGMLQYFKDNSAITPSQNFSKNST